MSTLLLSVVWLVLIAAATAGAYPRTVLVEHFTNWG
jgi:hypothetical protein